MSVRLLVVCAAPPCVCTRALADLKAYARGQHNYSRIKPHHHLVIRIGHRWRLLSKDNGHLWRLMTHETYNKESRQQ